MLRIETLIAALFASLTLFSCGTKDDKKSTGPTSEIDGTWSSPCLDMSILGSLQSVLVNSSGSSTQTLSYFSDQACKTISSISVYSSTFTTGAPVSSPPDAKEYNSKLNTMTMTLKTDREVTNANSEGMGKICSGGFVKDQAKTLTAADCASDSERKNEFNDEYSFYKIDGNKLYIGECSWDSATNCATPAKRPTTMPGYFYQK
jgi:hypothetical protein